MYTTRINQNGMILLNKDARKALGLKLGDMVFINFDKNSARIARRMSDEEFFAKMDANNSEKTKAAIKKNAGKTISEMRNEWAKSMAGQKCLEKKYGSF